MLATIIAAVIALAIGFFIGYVVRDIRKLHGSGKNLTGSSPEQDAPGTTATIVGASTIGTH